LFHILSGVHLFGVFMIILKITFWSHKIKFANTEVGPIVFRQYFRRVTIRVTSRLNMWSNWWCFNLIALLTYVAWWVQKIFWCENPTFSSFIMNKTIFRNLIHFSVAFLSLLSKDAAAESRISTKNKLFLLIYCLSFKLESFRSYQVSECQRWL